MISGVSARAAADPAAMEALSDACFGRVPTVRTPPLRLTTETSTKLEIQRWLKTETRRGRETVLAIIGRPRTEDRCQVQFKIDPGIAFNFDPPSGFSFSK